MPDFPPKVDFYVAQSLQASVAPARFIATSEGESEKVGRNSKKSLRGDKRGHKLMLERV